MSVEPPNPASSAIDTLLAMWSRGQLSDQETLRTLIQYHIRQQRAIESLNSTVRRLRSDLDEVIAQTGVKPRF